MRQLTVAEVWMTQFLINLFGIALRAFQQLNVMNSEYLMLIPTSYLMGISVIVTTLTIVSIGNNIKNQTISLFIIGTAGWMGSWLAIALHNWIL